MSKPRKTKKTVKDTSCNTKAEGRAWFFTWNNYTEEGENELRVYCTTKKTEKTEKIQYGWGHEVGDSGTPHLQGWIYFPSPKKFSTLKNLFPKIHWEQAESLAACKKYCKKEGKYIGTDIEDTRPLHVIQYDDYMKSTYEQVHWYDWQQKILDICTSKPSTRKVHWFWESEGNRGKSFLTKYIDWKYNAIIANGKQADVFNQYKSYLDTEGKQPTIAIIDIPRSHKDFVCYSTLEKIKDGLIYSGKYEGGKLRLIPHHLIIFANFEPDLFKLSTDRWDIEEI